MALEVVLNLEDFSLETCRAIARETSCIDVLNEFAKNPSICVG